jgi:2-dehydro-3-deoxy-D-arabinonate dehydratase
MKLTRHQTQSGPRWAADGYWLADDFDLYRLLEKPLAAITAFLTSQLTTQSAEGALLPSIESNQEVWASGVTYLRSREARQAESDMGDVPPNVPNCFSKHSAGA